MRVSTLWFGLALMVAGCAPSPKNVPCSNGGECTKVDARFNYCLQSRCVECISSSSCGEGRLCTDGTCTCESDVGCPGQRCEEGVCRPK